MGRRRERDRDRQTKREREAEVAACICICMTPQHTNIAPSNLLFLIKLHRVGDSNPGLTGEKRWAQTGSRVS